MKSVYRSVAGLTLVLELSGCTGGGASAPKPAVASDASDYSMRAGDASALEKVGCLNEKNDVACARFDDSKTDDAAQALEGERRLIERQKNALVAVLKNVDEDVKSKKLGPAAYGKAVATQAALQAAQASLITREADLAVANAKEALFSTTLGYSCSDSAERSASAKATMPWTVLASGAQDAKTAYSSAEFSASFTIRKSESRLRWLYVNAKSPTDATVKISVDADSDYRVASKMGGAVDLFCGKVRASGTDAKILDRPLRRRTLNCHAAFLFPNPNNDQTATHTINSELQVGLDANAEPISLIEEYVAPAGEADSQYDLARKSLKYYARLTPKDGLLTFEVYSAETKDVVATMITSNSIPYVKFYIDDNQRNGVEIECDTMAR